MRIHFIHTLKGWRFLHSLSCNPHCSLQHYQMKENPTAFGKKWSFWMWLKKNLYAFFWEDYCADKPQILTSINHISSETPFKEFRCDDCLESRRWTEANSPRFFTHFTWTKSQGHWLVMIAWWYDENLREYFSNCSHGRVYGCKWNCWAVEMQVRWLQVQT